MYFDDYRFHRGPSVDDDPTQDGPAGASPASAQEGQASQPGGSPRMNLNGQTVPGQEARSSRTTDPSGQYRPAGDWGRARRQQAASGFRRPAQAQAAPRKKTNPWGRRIAGLVLCGLLFGGVAGLTFHGTTSLLAAGSSEESAIAATQLSATAVGSLDVSDIAAGTLPSVVSITNKSVTQVNDWFSFFYGGAGRTQESVSVGSGVLIQQTGDALYIVTNYHVVSGATTLSATFADDQTYEAQLVGGDEANDIAVIRVPLSSVSASTLSAVQVAAVGDSGDLKVGQQVVAIGNALGYGQSVTTGVVSALERSLTNDAGQTGTYIQTDAAINPGNSGGALVNMDGQVVGINTAKLASTEVEGMGYAIPMARVAEIVSGIIRSSSAV